MAYAVHQLEEGFVLTNENGTEKYIIGKVLGEGGFGISYLAQNANLNEKVVVKEYFPRALVDREAVSNKVRPLSEEAAEKFKEGIKEFLNEAYRMLEFNNEPNVVSVKNFFQANNTAYIIMEFIDGQTLRQFLHTMPGGRLPLQCVLDFLTPIASTLERMHTPKKNINGYILREAMIHRDISPDNIMLTSNGTAKLLDFGAARSSKEKAVNSGAIMFMGDNQAKMMVAATSGSYDDVVVTFKAGYTPLEQLVATYPEGPWTDVYALAATIYHAITGQLPPDTISRKDTDTLKPPSSFGIVIEPFQERALLKGLAPNYADRYQTINEFMLALSRSPDTSKVVDTNAADKNIMIVAIVLASVGWLIVAALFLFSVYMLLTENLLLEADFLIAFLATMTSTTSLGLFIWELIRLYEARAPIWLGNVSYRDSAFMAQATCAAVILFLTFVYPDIEPDGFISEVQFTVFLNFDFLYDEAESFVNKGIVIYALSTIAGMWLGRQFLQKNI